MTVDLLSGTFKQIRTGIAENMRSIKGLQVLDYVSSQPVPPSADVRRGPVEYDQAMADGLHRPTMLVRVYVANVTDQGSQSLLDSYLDPDGDQSVKAAIESDRTLGGVVADLHVTGASGAQQFALENQPVMLGSEWTVEVWL